MTAAMLIIGVLFGFALSVTLALFGILSMGGRFVDNAKAALAEAQSRLTGRQRLAAVPATARSGESESRQRALQEEVRVMQRLMEQARAEYAALGTELDKAAAELAATRSALGEKAQAVADLETRVQAERQSVVQLQDSLAERCAELAQSRRELRDLQTELSVLQSGTGCVVNGVQ